MLTWIAGNVGGLRMRFGAADQVKSLKDTIVTDARADSAASLLNPITGVRILQANGYALLFVGTQAGVKLFRIESGGQLTPLRAAIVP